MNENGKDILSGVPETLLIPLHVRAVESQRPDALLVDETSVSLAARLEPHMERIRRINMDDEDRVALILRNREFDRRARDFLARRHDAVIVHIGCGFDSRFERVDNGSVEWYDLDVPDVIGLRKILVPSNSTRCHLLGCSVFDDEWLPAVSKHRRQPLLFLAEGILMYFREAQVKSLVLKMREHFPGSEFVFDAFSPFLVHANNLRLKLSRSAIGARYNKGLKRGRDIEKWGEGIRLLDEWYPFDAPEPRLARVQWVRRIPLIAKCMGIFHYRLG